MIIPQSTIKWAFKNIFWSQALSHRFFVLNILFLISSNNIILLYPALCLLSVCTTLTNINYFWRYLTLTHSFYVFFLFLARGIVVKVLSLISVLYTFVMNGSISSPHPTHSLLIFAVQR
jgi:hypothetical protein